GASAPASPCSRRATRRTRSFSCSRAASPSSRSIRAAKIGRSDPGSRPRWLSADDARAVLADPGPAGAELRFILLAAFTEALANTTRHLRDLLTESAAMPAPDLDRLLALLHGAKR